AEAPPTKFVCAVRSYQAQVSAKGAERYRHGQPFCTLGIVQPETPALMWEINGAKPARDASFTPLKHLKRCTPLVWESARCTAFREANVSSEHLTCRTWEVHFEWGLQF